MIRIKICCILTVDEMRAAVRAGASAVGLVGHMPSGPGIISDKTIADIASKTPPPVATFLLTSETDSKKIIEHQERVRTGTIQIVDRLKTGSYQDIRTALPGIKIVQVIHVTDESSAEEAVRCSAGVDALLLDSGNPDRAVKELGGTGRTHNWRLSRSICESVSVPVFLAGGLNPENVRRAIETVEPFGVDVCSGVRSDGKLDLTKLKDFMQAVQTVIR